MTENILSSILNRIIQIVQRNKVHQPSRSRLKSKNKEKVWIQLISKWLLREHRTTKPSNPTKQDSFQIWTNKLFASTRIQPNSTLKKYITMEICRTRCRDKKVNFIKCHHTYPPSKMISRNIMKK